MATLFAEQDQERLYQRLRAVTAGDLTSDKIARLVEGDLSVVDELPSTARHGVAALLKPGAARGVGGLEKLVGPALDIVPVAYLDLARMAADAVGRIVDDGRTAVGTGTMVSSRLLLTNHHVTPDPEAAAKQIAQFGYELRLDGVPKVPCEFRLDPVAFFWTSPVDELDATLVAIGTKASGESEIGAFGMSSLTAAQDKHAEGDFVTIIQHPDGDYKQVALRENRVIGRGKSGATLHYQGDTLPGSSGSPVFNDQFELVALHHAGGCRNETHLENGTAISEDSNEGIRISRIVAALRDQLDRLPDMYRKLLAETLDPASSGPRMPGVESAASGAPGGAGVVVTGSADVSVPLRISFGATPTTAAAVAVAATPVATGLGTAVGGGTIERNQPPDQNYQNRRGYDASFLGIDVPMPALSKAQAKQAAVPKGAGKKAGPALPYFHFSVVQNGERKMPFFTAVNIDGKRAKSINRETGEVEASEVWFCDPRIGDDAQLSQAIFQAQRPRLFDRGHLVRRLDPAWGSAETALRAADDTFHFTNCSLQISAFNQRAALWAGIENYVLDNAKAERKKVSVFSGPVFRTDDPEYRGVQVPMDFWKVLVRVDGGRLRATAFVAAQGDLVRKGLASLEAIESFGDLGRVSVFNTNVTTVAKQTGLDFGDLHQFDTRRTESVGGVELASLDDVEW